MKNGAWWPSWRKDTIEYCHTCDRCQKANRSTVKKFELMIHIKEPKSLWEVVHMDWVTELPPSGDRSYNAGLAIVDRYSQTPIFLPCHKAELFLLQDGLEERTIQTLEDMIRRFCAYGSEFKDSDGFTHYCCTLIPALELAYKTSVHSSTDPNKLKDSYVEPFFIFALHGTNEVQVEFSGELENKHPIFPVSLIRPYQQADKELFPLRNPAPLTVPPVEQSEHKKIKKVIKERRLRVQNQREDLVRYIIPENGYERLAESEIPDSNKLLRIFRHKRRPQS
ncbi:hypothetical protein O181_031515 [Austropuccinia psidii MF-1]|uniref:Integrase zinc-binding domain-containing protein n=1 Tax=Austropuccinia psidii MF-1 TaxID=1389203 RepID=A0A9Q3H7A4_9BASI|nr:hypothetical protein [Austropuccinia psidii MF-1]